MAPGTLEPGTVDPANGPSPEAAERLRAALGLPPPGVLDALAAKWGTPLFVYDASVLEGRHRALRAALPARVEVLYSVKANPAHGVVRRLALQGAGAEAASRGELDLALRAGIPPRAVVLAGPGKQAAEHRRALEAGIHAVHVESLGEAARLSTLAAGLGVRAPVALRVNPVAPLRGGLRMGGAGPSAFGVDEEQAEEAAAAMVRDPHLEFLGLHVYAATQVLDVAALVEGWRRTMELAGRLARATGAGLRWVDLGGGIGTAYHAGQEEPDLVAMGRGLAEVLEDAADTLAPGGRVALEPGRALAAHCGVYVVGVVDVKTSRGTQVAVCDGGMHHFAAATGNLGQVLRRPFPILPLRTSGALRPTLLAGPLCTPLDTFGVSLPMPALQPGDRLAVLLAGAYGLTASHVRFLSRPQAREVVLDGGRAAPAEE